MAWCVTTPSGPWHPTRPPGPDGWLEERLAEARGQAGEATASGLGVKLPQQQQHQHARRFFRCCNNGIPNVTPVASVLWVMVHKHRRLTTYTKRGVVDVCGSTELLVERTMGRPRDTRAAGFATRRESSEFAQETAGLHSENLRSYKFIISSDTRPTLLR